MKSDREAKWAAMKSKAKSLRAFAKMVWKGANTK